MGDAVSEAIKDSEWPISLGELVSELQNGGLHTNGRAVNASLLNLKGVVKNEVGRYSSIEDYLPS